MLKVFFDKRMYTASSIKGGQDGGQFFGVFLGRAIIFKEQHWRKTGRATNFCPKNWTGDKTFFGGTEILPFYTCRMFRKNELFLMFNYFYLLNFFSKRGESFGWNTLVVDGHSIEALSKAFHEAEHTSGQPTLIVAQTYKGKDMPEQEDRLNWHGKPMPRESCDKIVKHIQVCACFTNWSSFLSVPFFLQNL